MTFQKISINRFSEVVFEKVDRQGITDYRKMSKCFILAANAALLWPWFIVELRVKKVDLSRYKLLNNNLSDVKIAW